MDGSEFADWMAYDRKNPIGELRNDLRFARLLQAVLSKGSTNPPTFSMCVDLLNFDYKGKSNRQSGKEMDRVLASYAAGWSKKKNGTVNNTRNTDNSRQPKLRNSPAKS